MNKPEGREELHDYLQQRAVKDAIEQEDLNYVYKHMPSGNRWMLTEFLYSLDIDPLEYVNQIYSQMFVYHEGTTVRIPRQVEFIDYYAFQLSDVVELIIENNDCSFHDQAFVGMNPDCAIHWCGNVYGTDGRKKRN